MIPTPVAFWNLNGSRLDSVRGLELVSGDGVDRYVDGKIGQAWQTVDLADGTYHPLTCVLPSPINIQATGLTVLMWVKIRPGTQIVIPGAFSFGSSGERCLIYNRRLNTAPTVAVWSNVEHGGVTSHSSWNATTYIPVGEWALIGMQLEPGVGITSIMNLGRASVARSDDMPGPIADLTVFGGSGIAAALNGAGDSVGIWDSVLSESQLQEIYNAGNGWEYTPPDNTPDAFDFPDVADADLATEYISDPQTITGIDSGTTISVSGGAYRINGGAWTTDAGTIDAGQTLELRATSSNDPETPVTVTATVGTVSVDWTITTKAGRTLKQHFLVGPDGIAQSVGACVIVPGWV